MVYIYFLYTISCGCTPHGVRELKLPSLPVVVPATALYPTRGTWVEMMSFAWKIAWQCCTPHGVRELKYFAYRYPVLHVEVVPHTGYVSWNFIFHHHAVTIPVVPHTGYVSWNGGVKIKPLFYRVVPHTGYVSWNIRHSYSCFMFLLYPTRGTWVEIYFVFSVKPK